MSCPIGTEELSKLKLFVGLCSEKPELLNMPQLAFFKEFVEKLGGKVPEATADFSFGEPAGHRKEHKPTPAPEPQPESDPESDVDIDNSGCVDPDDGPEQAMGDSEKLPTEEESDKASEFRSQAAKHYSEQRYDEAVAAYEQAIILNPTNALYYAKRGQAYLKLNKPNACIRDCNRALELNCDSAAAYKFRGRAYRLLGEWQAAAKDLRQACNIDFDEEADEWLREVQPNAKKLEAHKIKQERKRAEKDLRERQERVRRAKEANKKAAEEQQRHEQPSFASANASAGPGGAWPGAEESGAGGFSQADILDAFKDPEVAAAFQDIMSNPANVTKYQSNPKIMNIITKVGAAMGGGLGGMGGMGGMGGGMPGGFPGMFPPGGGAFPNFSTPPPHGPNANKPSPDFQDDGLD